MAPQRNVLITESGTLTDLLLRSNRDEQEVYDVIVVGSGMGGGVVASALADEKKKVLVLEAGSLLFPTHVGNLPRRLMIGKFQKHIWSLWEYFSVKNYNTPPGSMYNGGQGFNLGGRSIFWGSSIPPLAAWELEVWPKDIQKFLLEGNGYDLARGVFNADVPELKDFHVQATEVLSDLLREDWEILPAPVAVEYTGATEWSVPAGIFSSVDLLLEDSLAEGMNEGQVTRQGITVNVNHAVWDVTFEDGNNKRVNGVRCWDLLDKKERHYKAKSVILCAGTVESAKIALNSKIPNDMIGNGIVDHAIYYRHFVIPPETLKMLGLTPDVPRVAPPRVEPQSTKILIRHRAATLDSHAFDIILELGAQFNQGRFVDKDHIEDDMDIRNGYLLCEIVFQFYAPLMQQNSVTLAPNGDYGTPVNIYMERAPVPPALLAEARNVAKGILERFNAQSILGEDALMEADGLPNLKEADVGGVAHEIGTLSMPVNGQKAVVDENLKFEGIENLYACDNSVFPCSPAGNPSLTLVALARRCAETVAKQV
ncbi:FAD/NAD(P)-binding domain-containing protein [Eremomyces bilateralis CBS 781.70]|uniref:FAD/NAD(P)-binding domain-containing protein n=1 Tax=Eremomyces bilateralis CBS 781.70 TaxID=1392243 RepID=A0A6G1G5M7_9PEZI|nr:FAD/NAD(P)-binding domain-containing protein [Eremomyces bilateralis CBS 781.70]KAF1813139.1 FAD/NAD(P)-binding domain-containing protein [Eremomyces bilateralis CBS 781.70]